MKTTVETLFEQLFTKSEFNALIRASLKTEVKPGAFYEYEEAAALLGLCKTTLIRAVKDGGLKASYFGATPRLLGQDLIDWSRSGGRTGRSTADVENEKTRAASRA